MPANPIAAVLRLAEVDDLIERLRMSAKITAEQHMTWIRGLAAGGLNLRGPGDVALAGKMQRRWAGMTAAGDVYAIRGVFHGRPVPGAQLLDADAMGGLYQVRSLELLQELKKASGPR